MPLQPAWNGNPSRMDGMSLSEQQLPIVPTTEKRVPPLELWGGVECTHNRVGDQYISQLELSGHIRRVEDLGLFGSLGMKAIRYPVLWEMIAPCPTGINWAWADERLGKLREMGIRPIAGLVHHGSGPPYAPVDSAAFAPGLACFARKVAERFPWLDAYTPVNEPLTTSRFCGLYRLWYPHGGDNHTFVRVLVNQCKAIVLAMKEVRKINPVAILVQPDDLGRVYGTSQMADEVDFQNHRRWLGWDLVSGMVSPHHALWAYLLAEGIEELELDWFRDNPCPPDVIGINHYPTSDRYLEHDTTRFPDLPLTRDAGRVHVDLEAVRVRPEPIGGFHKRLLEAWDRYRRPLAITEAHLGCTREDQLRWFADSWSSAVQAREGGVDVVAVTAWSLLGSFNWNTLVTRDTGHYEPGVFDVRSGTPRPTALAPFVKYLGEHGESKHHLLKQTGWWQRPERLLLSKSELGIPPSYNRRVPAERASPLLIFGANSVLGNCYIEACKMRGLDFVAPLMGELNFRDEHAVRQYFQNTRPWAVVNATGDASENPSFLHGTSRKFDLEFALLLSAVCSDKDIALLCFSSAQVFGGVGHQPHMESMPTEPKDSFSELKLAMEEGVLNIHPSSLVVRSGPLYGVGEKHSVLSRELHAIMNGKPIIVESEAILSPTFLPDLVDATLDLLIDGASGIWHLANAGQRMWAQLLREVAQLVGFDEPEITVIPSPRFDALGTERGQILPPIDDAIARYARRIKTS